jgi:HTH-type transcriptional repressor of NAD biosynthesis genes
MDAIVGTKNVRGDMYNVGVFPGKFIPPHRGHLMAIIRAATQVKKLYVVVSDSEDFTSKVCSQHNLRFMSLALRAKWLSQELQGFEHIKVIMLDETGIPFYPEGTKKWSALLKKVIPTKFDVIFGGELEYQKTYMQNFPNVEYSVFDYSRTRYPISATEIRANPLKHWDYILGCARPHFAKRILVTGTESCGKTTLVKSLAKIFHTSWAEEVGRYYSERHLGGNEDLFSIEDFFHIAYEQVKIDEAALRSANRIVFFDTDAVVTQFYCELYMKVQNPDIEMFVEPNKYDKVLFLAPNVKWVPDGLRWNEDQSVRYRLHEKLRRMYIERGFSDKMINIEEDSYVERLDKAVEISDVLLEEKKNE